MKKYVTKTILALTLCGGILVGTATETRASVTAGISSILGQELTETAHLTIASIETPLSAAGETAVPETEAPVSIDAGLATQTPSEGLRAGVLFDLQVAMTDSTETETQSITGALEENESASVTEAAAGSVEAAPEELQTVSENEEAPVTVCGYTNLGIANITEGNLNIRETPGEDGALAGKLPKDAACEILAEADGWSQIKSGEVEGYVKSEFLMTGDAARAKADELKTLTATVTADVLNVREQANTDCEIVDQMANGEEIPVLEQDGEWIKVDVDGEERYIKAEYVSVEEKLNDALTLTEARYGEGISDVRVAVVDFATQFVGNPYVWGGTSLTNGADCSGFVLSVMANYGVYLPHSSAAQANCGTRVSADELLPGDLIFYGSGKSIGHVAIYIGNGQICHASNRRTGITISNMYYRSPICCTRVL